MSQLNTLVPLSVFTIESVPLILVIAKDSGTITRKTGSPFVQFISREISQATGSLTFSTRNSILETRDSILDPRYSKLSRIEARGTVNLLLSGTVFQNRSSLLSVALSSFNVITIATFLILMAIFWNFANKLFIIGKKSCLWHLASRPRYCLRQYETINSLRLTKKWYICLFGTEQE